MVSRRRKRENTATWGEEGEGGVAPSSPQEKRDERKPATDGRAKQGAGKKERIGFEPPQVHFHRKVGLSGKRQQKYSPQSSLIAVALATKKREGQKRVFPHTCEEGGERKRIMGRL